MHVAGTTLTVPAGKGFGGTGAINDPVVCQGTITAAANGVINLANGLVLSGNGNVNLGSGGTLTVNDTASGMTAGTLTGIVIVGMGGTGVFSPFRRQQLAPTQLQQQHLRPGLSNAGDSRDLQLDRRHAFRHPSQRDRRY